MSDQQRGKRYPDDDDKPRGIGRGGFVDEGHDDAEGHGLRAGVTDEAQDDAEGHASRFGGRVTDEPAQDDAEGHGMRGHVVEEPASGADDDDAEGHAVRIKI